MQITDRQRYVLAIRSIFPQDPQYSSCWAVVPPQVTSYGTSRAVLQFETRTIDITTNTLVQQLFTFSFKIFGVFPNFLYDTNKFVANYPFDNNAQDAQRDSPSADDAVFREVSLAYR